ncbi:tRNA dihydrouridine synthase DusB, partial [Xenorhabdus sp. CUL]|nr:tRNA dihydrouridine synthase DusB [Xenorhabdus sp. CUL]
NGINTCNTRQDLANVLGAFVEEVEAKQQTIYVG